MTASTRNLRAPRSMSEAWGEGATLHTSQGPSLAMRIARALVVISAVVAIAALCSGCTDDLDMQAAIESDKAQAVLDARASDAERKHTERGETVAASYELHRKAILNMNATLTQHPTK